MRPSKNHEREMTDLIDEKDCKPMQLNKMREAEKMIEDGVSLTVICKVLKIPLSQLQHLGTKGETNFK